MSTSWFKDAVVYQILIDRFSAGGPDEIGSATCDGPVFCGGTLRGIVDMLDYLQDLGINTVWLTPFNKTAGYHGYHTTDFYQVDPHFGSIGDLDALIQSAHGRGIRVIMDFVANHVHRTHPIFEEALSNPNSEYRDWFYFKPSGEYMTFLSVKELPKLNLSYPAAADYVTSAAVFWLDRGIDGLRLDHVVGPPVDFWPRFNAAVKAGHADTVTIGEVFLEGITWNNWTTVSLKHSDLLRLAGLLGINPTFIAMRQYVGILDGVLDFRFQELMKRFIAHKRWYRPRWLLALLLRLHYASYPRGFFLPAFLDNHDMSRFLYEAGQDKGRLKEAASVQFRQQQPPIIYYGTEVGITQDKPTSSSVDYSDLNSRQLMRWDERQDRELLGFYKALIAERKARVR